MKLSLPKLAGVACLSILGCQEQVGSEDYSGDTSHSTDHSIDNSTNKLNSIDYFNTSIGVGNNENDIVIDPREQQGEWTDKDRFTLIPPSWVGGDHLDKNGNLDLCWIAWRSDTIALVRLHRIIEEVNKCEGEDEPKNIKGYVVFEAERLLHLGGEPLPIYFSLRKMSGTQTVDPKKDYIIGVREYEEGFYSASGAFEVVEYDPVKESSRLAVSGKKEALITQAEAYTGELRKEYCNETVTREEFRQAYFDLEGAICD